MRAGTRRERRCRDWCFVCTIRCGEVEGFGSGNVLLVACHKLVVDLCTAERQLPDRAVSSYIPHSCRQWIHHDVHTSIDVWRTTVERESCLRTTVHREKQKTKHTQTSPLENAQPQRRQEQQKKLGEEAKRYRHEQDLNLCFRRK